MIDAPAIAGGKAAAERQRLEPGAIWAAPWPMSIPGPMNILFLIALLCALAALALPKIFQLMGRRR